MARLVTVAMDLPPDHRFHRATLAALAHAIDAVDANIKVRVERTDSLSGAGEGVVIGPGSPYRDAGAAEDLIRRARENGVPLVAT